MKKSGSPVLSGFRTLQSLWSRFERHQGMLRASALSFDTILGLVPFLALIFVGLKLTGVQNLLVPFMMSQLTGNLQEAGAKILEYINNVNIATLGFFGLFALLGSLFLLLENIRNSFNAIWDLEEPYTLMRRSIDYLTLVLAAPLLLVVTFGMTSFLESRHLVKWLITKMPFAKSILLLFGLTPFISSSMLLILTYMLLSGTRVRFRSALFGGFVIGALWQLAHWGYFHFQFGIVRYNSMYGALALLPFLLIWIYTSWLLVLAGLELVRWHQESVLNQVKTSLPPGEAK